MPSTQAVSHDERLGATYGRLNAASRCDAAVRALGVRKGDEGQVARSISSTRCARGGRILSRCELYVRRSQTCSLGALQVAPHRVASCRRWRARIHLRFTRKSAPNTTIADSRLEFACKCSSPMKPGFDVSRNTSQRTQSDGSTANAFSCVLFPSRSNVAPAAYMFALPGQRGNGMTSRMFSMPVTYMMRRSKPRPNPARGIGRKRRGGRGEMGQWLVRR
jgi:hypothetical protein